MGRRIFLAGFLGWMVALTGCAGGKVSLLGTPTSLHITASSATVRAEESIQLSVSDSDGGTSPAVQWSVNGIAGGDATFGTVSATGLYTAPARLPANNLITITADNGSGPASTEITLWNPIPVVSSVQANDLGDSLQLNISGNRFVLGAQVNFGGTIYPATVTSPTQLQAVVSSTAASAAGIELAVSNPAPGAAFSESTLFSVSRPGRSARGSFSNFAARFLDQATFGATAADIATINQLRTQLGTTTQAFSQYIDNQIVATPSSWADWTTPNPNAVPLSSTGQALCGTFMNCAQILWFQNALRGPDQLRQRTAFALSQIWVVSGNTVQLSDSFLTYYGILNNRAFGNYYQIMDEVTRSSAMGYYLDMGNSAKAANGGIANENYPREFLQLFTLGLYLLNDDGTFQLDTNGQRIPTYTEEQVQEFARAMTGWTYQRNNGTASWNQSFTNVSTATTGTNRKAPMVPVESFHDTSAKTLLNYPGVVSLTLNPGNLAQQDLDGVLQNVFNHPNLPPFVSQQLIQHLVTSNPSPAYVGRVSAVFRNNGQGVRGDMAAVIRAILLDPEARQADQYPINNHDGHLKEPALFITGIVRSLNYTDTSTSYTGPSGAVTNLAASLVNQSRNMGQNVLHAPSVFNYYSPQFAIQGGTLLGPEFQLHTTANATTRATFADTVVRNQIGSGINVQSSIDALAAIAANSDQLIDRLDQMFHHGQMSTSMRQTIHNTIAPMPITTVTDRNFRAKIALFLALSSSQYQVQR